jgi:hypothetical protein
MEAVPIVEQGSKPVEGTEGSLDDKLKHTLFYFHSCMSDGKYVQAVLRKLKDYVNTEDFKVVVPCSPLRVEAAGSVIPSWYLYKSDTEGPHPGRGREELKEVKEYLEIGLEEEFERVTKTGGKIFMYGISQGVSVMTHLLLQCDSKILKKVALVVCNRGWTENISFKNISTDKQKELIELREKAGNVFPKRNVLDISVKFHVTDPEIRRDKPLLDLEYPVFFALLAGMDNCCLPHISTKLYKKLERYFPVTYLFNDAISHGGDWAEEMDIVCQAIKEFLPDSHKTEEYNKEGIFVSPEKMYGRGPAYKVDRLVID